jgi:hypothetical protein
VHHHISGVAVDRAQQVIAVHQVARNAHDTLLRQRLARTFAAEAEDVREAASAATSYSWADPTCDHNDKLGAPLITTSRSL